MSRVFAGIHGVKEASEARLGTALAPAEASFFAAPGVAVTYGGAAQAGISLCLLDGRLDDVGALRRGLAGSVAASSGRDVEEELLLAAYRRWGKGMLTRLRGDFAIFVWDGERRRGLLARDQLGVRPLFFHQAGGALRFAGEARDLLRLLPQRPVPDEVGVAHWLALGSRPDDGTLYAGVRRLGPGEALLLDGETPRRYRYWQPRYRAPIAAPMADLEAEVGVGLERSVARRLDPEGATGLLLSGGLDSASIAAFGGGRLLACSGVFPEHPQADEAALLATLREELGLRGLVAEVRPGGLLAAAVEHLVTWQLPLLGWGDFWALPLMRAARERGAGTVLGGDGGDEVFGARGYALADALRQGRPREVAALARRLPGRVHASRGDEARMVARLAVAGALPPLGPTRLRLPVTARRLPDWLDRRVIARAAATADPEAWKRLDGPRWWANAAHGIVYGIEATGVHEHQRRRARMAEVEARHPMLDLDLVELALRLPPESTLDSRFSRPLLRGAAAGRLPDGVRLRPEKAIFESLIVSTLRGPDAAAVERLLCAPDAELGTYLDRTAMRAELFGSDLVDRAPFAWMWQVWRLVNLELWLRLQSGGIGSAEPIVGVSEAQVEIFENAPPPTFFHLDRGPLSRTLEQ